MIDVVFIATLIAFFALMVAFVHWCERIVGKEDVAITDGSDDEVPADPTGDRPIPTPTRHRPRRGGTGMKSYDNLVGLILAVLVTAYLIYALIAPEKL